MGKGNTNDIVRIAAEIGAKTALETLAKEQQKERRSRTNKRLRDTKRLLRNYREIKVHADEAISSLADADTEDYDFFQSLMEGNRNLEVASITQSKARSAVMLTHIDSMIKAYETICYGSGRPEEQRRYRILENICLKDSPYSIYEIAEMEGIDERTVYRDFDIACEKMSALLFGIQWIERE